MGTEARHKGVEPIFSAKPPLETLRILVGVACQEDVFQVEDPMLITIADVSRAHFYADAARDVYVRLPSEGPQNVTPRRVWETAKDNVWLSGCGPTMGRALRASLGERRMHPRRGVLV